MKNTTTLLRACTLTLLLAALSHSGFCQSSVPKQYQADYNKMMKDNGTRNAGSNTRFYENDGSFHLYGTIAYNIKHTFFVMLKDGSQISVPSKMHWDTARESYYLLMVNKDVSKKDTARETRIYPGQTLQLSRTEEEPPAMVTGKAADTCWMFKIISGKINVYSHLSELDYNNSAYIDYIQLGDDGPIKNFTPELLQTVLSAHTKALRLCNKGEFYRAIVKYNGE